MKQPDSIIILHHTLYSERSVILHTISRAYGRRSFIVKNASRCMSFFQPLNILDCDITKTDKSQLYSASGFSSAHPLGGIRSSFAKNAISMFMAEVLLRAVKEGVQEEGLYEWCRNEILVLDAMESGHANFHIRFLLDLAAATGFSPGFEDLLPFATAAGGGADSVMIRNLRMAVECGPADAMLLKMTGAERSKLCAILLKYLEFHLDSPLRIRSLDVLAELF